MFCEQNGVLIEEKDTWAQSERNPPGRTEGRRMRSDHTLRVEGVKRSVADHLSL